MTEIEWWECTDPKALLREAADTSSKRQLRLFMAACCRSIWHRLLDEASRQAVLVAERYADGLASAGELRAVYEKLWRRLDHQAPVMEPAAHATQAALSTVWSEVSYATAAVAAGAAAAAAAYLVAPVGSRAAARVGAAESVVQCRLLRDILGNPFRPVAPRSFPAPVLGLAQSIDEGDHDLYPVLADALADLGEERAAAHCREPLHVKGCHVVGWVLGRR